MAAFTRRFPARMRGYLDDLEQRNGTPYLELVAITLARVHSKSLAALATGADTIGLLDAAEMEALEPCRFRHAEGVQVDISGTIEVLDGRCEHD
ncbi:hypothetical protein [Arthrobacter sp. ok362]|uniref:hypothetical protein n=1 Tax=Arthrobacter sp. ok362 TaxID=1761745 RepID=UPI00088A500B|nr:hypothetical protein [Arthrobacter sp. ok362]SDL94822.1 hypothetical protein SAMN04487913_11865 [Arthrobacter sp. ok362]